MGETEGPPYQDHQFHDTEKGHCSDQYIQVPGKGVFRAYKIHGLRIDIILHFLDDKTCDHTDVAVHTLHSVIVLFFLRKLLHPFS